MSALRILCCNDDGIDAPGLALAFRAAATLSDDVWVVAPERKWTAASHHVTFDVDLALARVGEQRYACSGTPVDGVIAAMSILFTDRRPDLLISGVNDKRNVAEDIAYSGTIAIAREATFWGVVAIALSGEGWNNRADDEVALLARLIATLWDTRSEWSGDGAWLAVNLPNSLPAPIACARIGHDKIAGACDVIDADPARIVYRLRRGRPGSQQAEDENAVIARGDVCIVRQRWQADATLPASLIARWQAAIDASASSV